MKSLSAKTFQCGVTVQGLTTLSGTVYLTALTNTATWDYVVVGTTAQGQLYTRTYAQLMSDITSGIGLSGYVPTSRTLTINGVSYDLTANRSWTISTVDYTSRLQHVVKAGVAINKGQAVYVTSADGTNMIVGLASNASEATSSKTMGLLDATVSTNGFANVVTEGLLAGLDTSTAGAAGDPVWLGTGGNLIYGLANKPYAPAHLVFIGIVTRKNSNNGEIFVKVQNGFELNEIHDVDLKTNLPVNGELLGFNGTLWVNKTIAGWLGYTPANASGTTNYISKFTGSTTLGNSLIYDDGSNVGIGTTSPGARFTVQTTTSSSAHTLRVTDGTGIINIGHWDTVTNRFEFSGKPTYFVQYGTGNYISFGTLGSENMRIVAGGNVGIGTSSPAQKLDVAGGDIILSSNATYIRSKDASGNSPRMFGINPSNDTYIGPIDPYAGGAVFYGVSANVSSQTFYTGANARIHINSTGNVGIGVTNPANILQIRNGGGTTGYSGNDLVFYNANGESAFYHNSGGYVYWYSNQAITFYPGGSRSVTFSTGGNVGIGTTSPTDKLQVVASTYNGITITTPDVATFKMRSSSGATSWGFATTNLAANDFGIYQSNSGGGDPINAGTARLYFNGSGNVGIGTTSPTAKLHIGESGAAAQLWLQRTDGYNPVKLIGGTLADGNGFKITMNTTDAFSITSAGNVGIGTTSPSELLEVVGNIRANISNGGGFMLTGASASGLVRAGATGLALRTNTTDRLTVDNSGNVGIGTTDFTDVNFGSPALKIAGSRATLGLTSSGTLATIAMIPASNTAKSIHLNQSSDGSFRWYQYSVGAETFVLDAAGNVGIGITNPGTKVDIGFDANNRSIVRLNSNAANRMAAVTFYGNNVESSTIGYEGGSEIVSGGVQGDLVIRNHLASKNIVLITNGGNVGIGTTSPTNRLQIGSIGSSGYGGNDLAIGNGTQVMAFYQSSTVSTWYTNTSFSLMPSGSGSVGNVGIGTLIPSTLLDVNGVITATGGNSTNWNTAYGWGNHSSAGYVPQARTLTINGTSYDLSANRSWTIATTTPGGSDTQFQYNSSGSLAGASALTYNSTTNRVGINQASPGYDLDVNGQVRVQDKLRVGTVNSGNGVVHMSSSATINPSATTIVWAQNVSVGMCAFIEYYILNNNSLTDQRAGTIMVTWNQSGTPTIAHTETTTPDIGSTIAVNFTSSLVGSDARINAVNSSANPYTIVMSYKYF